MSGLGRCGGAGTHVSDDNRRELSAWIDCCDQIRNTIGLILRLDCDASTRWSYLNFWRLSFCCLDLSRLFYMALGPNTESLS